MIGAGLSVNQYVSESSHDYYNEMNEEAGPPSRMPGFFFNKFYRLRAIA